MRIMGVTGANVIWRSGDSTESQSVVRITNTNWSVQGVGGRVALAILSALGPDELSRAVSSRDQAMIARANGVGPKLAQRIANERARRELSPRKLFQVVTETSDLMNALPHRLDLITQCLINCALPCNRCATSSFSVAFSRHVGQSPSRYARGDDALGDAGLFARTAAAPRGSLKTKKIGPPKRAEGLP